MQKIVEPKQHTERIQIGGLFVERTLTDNQKMGNNELPVIVVKCQEFLKEHDP
ncbi:conserved hypothetical protein [delta proteobacterium NaphS2]|nr:conserved hypothetical protein [delta proteobacterium NaphS2]